MSRLVLASVAIVFAVSACSTEPFQVRAPKDLEIAELSESEAAIARGRFDFDPTPWAFGLCYSGMVNNPEDLVEKAREVCPHGHIESRDEDLFWNDCALFQPRRATFVCYPEPEPAPGA